MSHSLVHSNQSRKEWDSWDDRDRRENSTWARNDGIPNIPDCIDQLDIWDMI